LLGVVLTLACPGERPSGTDRVEPDHAFSLPPAGSGLAWRQWGGPDGDFEVAASDLADSWPPEGPPLIWSRPLGGGYSAIVYDRGVLVTIYRRRAEDVVVALRADDGGRIWEYGYPSKTHEQNMLEYGSGPNATPLVLDDSVFTLGYGGTLNSLDLETGRLLWSLDLISDLGGQVLHCGNSASPIAYQGALIVLVGGNKQAVVALDPGDGSVIWRSAPGTVSYGTPIVIDVDGQDQLVYQSEDEIVGIDAQIGEYLWSYPIVNENRDNISAPIWGEDHLMWVSTQPDGGTRVLRLERAGSRTQVFWNALRLDHHVYASIGGQGSILAGIDVRTGKISWRRRGFEKVNFVHVGDKTILLDANGELALAKLSPEGITILSQATIADGPTWTVPTLVGRFLYVRDKRTIRALDLGGNQGPPVAYLGWIGLGQAGLG
jgi:outer membrane protein assembly factor BamB